jgi:CheY-like chemotaxis protein
MAPFSRPELRGLRILVVDPHDDSRELLALVLQGTGAAVFAANGFDMAVKAFDALEPQLVVTELGLPPDPRYALIQAIQARALLRTRRVLTVAYTSFAGGVEQQRCLAQGFDLHLAKPVDLETLLAHLAELVRERLPAAPRDAPVAS